MKFSIFTALVCTLIAQNVANSYAKKERLSQALEKGNPQKAPCLFLISITDFEDHTHEKAVHCEMDVEDSNPFVNGVVQSKGKRIVQISGNWKEDLLAKAERGEIASGVTTIFEANAVVKGSELVIPTGSKPSYGSKQGKGRRDLATSTGVKNVLVVRIIANDAQTGFTKAELSDNIFGTSGDPFNLKVGYDQCSYGKMTIVPTLDPSVVAQQSNPATEKGVYEVTIAINVIGASDGVVRDAVSAKLNTVLPNWTTNFELTMYCIPPGTQGTWIAYAYLNSYLSVYNNQWCNYPSVGLHEIGHNLNLNHSNDDNGSGVAQEYGDQSCMMGISYGLEDGPRMCFNGAKSWQLNWYSDSHKDFANFATEPCWTGDLTGIANYVQNSGQTTIVRIVNAGGQDYYVHFNRQVGINSETQEAGNQVMIAKAAGSAQSLVVAKMNAGQSYVIANIGGTMSTVTVTVNSITLTTAPPGKANISIVHSGFSCNPIPSAKPSSKPSAKPSSKPSAKPSSKPSAKPSSKPSAKPSSKPSAKPSSKPSSKPSAKPSAKPSSKPSAKPSAKPSSKPSANPNPTPVVPPYAYSESFENGYGLWKDGGNDARIYQGYAKTGLWSVRLRDNENMQSSIYLRIDLSVYNQLSVGFSFLARYMQPGMSLVLQGTTNASNFNGPWATFKEWNYGTDFINNVRYSVSQQDIPVSAYGNSIIRLMCRASSDINTFYVDDIVVTAE